MKLALFDLDGTVLDTLDDLCDSANAALAENGLPLRSRREVRRFLGNGIRNLMTQCVPAGTDDAALEQVLASMNRIYAAHCTDKTCPYPGIDRAVAALQRRGIRSAVVSNKPDYAVQTLARDYFNGLFDYAVGERAGIRRKPAPDMVYAAMEFFGCSREDTVYIGDSEVDLMTAENAGIPCISVSWGFRDRAQLAENGAQRIADTMEELTQFLETL